MSSDDESKKDEQNTGEDSAQSKDAEQAPSVASSDEKHDADQSQSVSVFPEHSAYDLEPIVIPENMRLGGPDDDSTRSEINLKRIKPPDPRQQAQSNDPHVPKRPALPPQPPIGSTLGKLKITPRKVQPEPVKQDIGPSEQSNEWKLDVLEPSEQSNEWTQIPRSESETISNTSSSTEVEPSSQPLSEVRAAGEDGADLTNTVRAGGEGGTGLTESVPASPPVQISLPQSAKNEDDAAFDDFAKNNAFPEQSAFDLEPIVIPEDQRLGAPPQAKPDPRKTAQNQKLSPIKIGQHRPTPRKAEPSVPMTAQSSDGLNSQIQIENNGSEVSLAQSDISANGDQQVVFSEESVAAEPAPVAPTVIEAPTEENKEQGWAEEQTGWEEIVDKQERWQEQTGWEEVAEDKNSWESGWNDSEQKQPPSQESQPEHDHEHAAHSELDSQTDTTSSTEPSEPFHKQADYNRETETQTSPASFSVDGVQTGDEEPVESDRQDTNIGRSGTRTDENQSPFAAQTPEALDFPEAASSAGEEHPEPADSGQFPAIVINNNQEDSPPVVSGQHDIFRVDAQTGSVPPDLAPPWSGASPQDGPPGLAEDRGNPLALDNLGIGTADIDQIILEHSNIQLTLKSGSLIEAEEEERVLRELLEKEQLDAEREAQLRLGIDPQSHSQEIISKPEPSSDAAAPISPDEMTEEPGYDDEEVLQDFQPTDSIYELAPFVLPATGDRLTDQDAPAKPTLPKSLQQAVNATGVAPERAAVPSPSSDPLVGTILAHSYEVLDVIGQGGMAIVYRAKQIATGRLVAIKTLRSQNPLDIARFGNEIKTHSQLDHKNVVDYIDSFNARGQLFLVMERVRGISLEEIIRTFGKLDDPGNIVDILSQILDALEYAHSGGLIHRDLKTANVILIKEEEEDMVVKILDFGIAKIQGDLQRLTHVGQALGSPIYMSPEQCTGKALTTKSDLYSLGVVAYETVTGTPPYSKGTLINVMAAHCNENIKPKPLSEMAPHLPKFKMLDQILQKSLQTSEQKRWQSASEFRTALQFWLRSVEINASYDELPVELMRAPVTEFDIDKLVASASSNTTPSKPTQPTFAWAKKEPVSEPAPVQPESPPEAEQPKFVWSTETPAPAPAPVPTPLPPAPDQGYVTGEQVEWVQEEQEHEDIWPEQQGGWQEGTKSLESVPGWGDRAGSTNEPWGASEKHRQTGDTQPVITEAPLPEPTPVAPLQFPPAPEPVQPEETASSSSTQALPDPNQKLFQSNYQAETSDLWNAQQVQFNQRRSDKSPVRDLLASPASLKLEQQNQDAFRTTGDNPPLPSPEFKSLNPGDFMPPGPGLVDELGTAGGAETAVPSETIDLRRRQSQKEEPPEKSNSGTYIVIGVIVAVILTAILGFIVTQDPFHLRPAPVKKEQPYDPFNDPAYTGTKEPQPADTPSTSEPTPSTTTDEPQKSDPAEGSYTDY